MIFRENFLKFTKPLVVAAAVVCILATFQQNTFWRGEIPLFERVVQFEKEFGRGHLLLAKAYYSNHQYNSAIAAYKTSLRIMQSYLDRTKDSSAQKFYSGFIKEIRFDLGHCYEAQDRRPDAVQEYEQALKIDPEDPSLHNNLGINYIYLNDLTAALPHLQKAVELNPQDLSSANNLAICLIQLGNIQSAKEILNNILQVHPDFLPAKQNLQRLENLPVEPAGGI